MTRGGNGSSSLTLSFVLILGVLIGGVAGSVATISYIGGSRKRRDDEDDEEYIETGAGGRGGSSSIRSRGLLSTNTSSTNRNSTRATGNYDTTITHVNFLSDVISRMWPYINVAGSQMIKETVEPMFVDMMPGPLQSIKFSKCDLGNVPIILDNVIVHELKKDLATGEDCIQFDWDVIWNSSSDIQLKGDYGISFGVKSIKLNGRMSILLKPLSNVIPCIDAIQYSFINPPNLELDFTGLANVADFSIVDKTIRQIIQDILASMIVLPLRMVYKMSETTNYSKIYTPILGVARISLKCGRGFVIEKHMVGKDDIPDVYCNIQLGCEKPIWKTSVIKDSCEPVWSNDEYNDFIVTDHDQIITIDVYDEDNGKFDSDDYLGSTKVTVGQLLLSQSSSSSTSSKGGMELPLVEKQKKGNEKLTGAYITLGIQIFPFTTKDHTSIISAASAEDFDSDAVDTTSPSKKSNLRSKFTMKKKKKKKEDESENNENQPLVGLLTVLIMQAYNVPLAKEDAETYVEVSYGGDDASADNVPPTKFQTGVVVDYPGYDALNPVFETPFHVPLSPDNCDGDVKLQLINNRPDPNKKNNKENITTVLGEIVITHEDLVAATNGTIQDKRAIGTNGAELEFSITLAGIISDASGGIVASSSVESGIKSRSMDTTVASAVATTVPASMTSTPQELVRVSISKGHGFQVRKRGPFKKDDVPDVYCVMKFGSMPQAFRTSTIKDSVDPTWDTTKEYQDYPLTSPNQVIHIDVYDENRKTKDDHYGTARISVGKVLLNGGSIDVEVMGSPSSSSKHKANEKTGFFITVQCTKL